MTNHQDWIAKHELLTTGIIFFSIWIPLFLGVLH